MLGSIGTMPSASPMVFSFFIYCGLIVYLRVLFKLSYLLSSPSFCEFWFLRLIELRCVIPPSKFLRKFSSEPDLSWLFPLELSYNALIELFPASRFCIVYCTLRLSGTWLVALIWFLLNIDLILSFIDSFNLYNFD